MSDGLDRSIADGWAETSSEISPLLATEKVEFEKFTANQKDVNWTAYAHRDVVDVFIVRTSRSVSGIMASTGCAVFAPAEKSLSGEPSITEAFGADCVWSGATGNFAEMMRRRIASTTVQCGICDENKTEKRGAVWSTLKIEAS